MYIRTVGIKNFRSFSESEFKLPLGRRITCISGHNGVGKSTLLAILSNCGELKKREGTHLNGSQLRGEYSEIIKHDFGHDTTGEKVSIELGKSFPEEELEAEELWFRATVQKKNSRNGDSLGNKENSAEIKESKRYRLIPKEVDERKTASKLRWPTYYLGLSRLYPAGEAAEVKSRKPRLNEEMGKEFASWYTDILGLPEKEVKPEFLTLSDVPKKKGAGVSTRNYGVLANSAGQDNVGQIILTVLSFEQLKTELGGTYNGGLLAIDELDATLHPAAQIKLFNFLQNKAKKLNLQIIFTCHSLSLIEHIIQSNCLEDVENNRLLYLTRARGKLEVNENPTLEALKADLNSKILDYSRPKVPLIAEDDVARDLLAYIFERYEKNFSLKPNAGSISYQQILLLLNSYSDFFVNALAVLDPDVNREDSRKDANKLIESPFQLMGEDKSNFVSRRVLVLPGTLPLERQYWELMAKKEDSDLFFSRTECKDKNVTYATLVRGFMRNWEHCLKYKEKRDFCKEWYKTLPADIKQLVFGEWCSENKAAVEKFLAIFTEEFNYIVSKTTM